MKIVFVSNYINHHQIPFCTEMREKLGENFLFIQTQPMEEERLKLGWKEEEDIPYVKYSYKEPKLCQKLIMESDITIWGGAEDETMLKPRLEAKKPVLRYSERLYKTGQWKSISPRGRKKKYEDHTKYNDAPVYLLCAGGFVAADFNIIKAYPGKRLKWGYFPEFREYNEQELDQLFENKAFNTGTVEILWVGRFIRWKHPGDAIYAVKELAKYNKNFHLTMIGGGELEEKIREKIKRKGLENYITLAGVKSPQEVRAAMEKADFLWMTSDHQEGWGAVMNEAMNSGCVVIANWQEGATPFLIDYTKNGFYCEVQDPQLIVGLTSLMMKSKELTQKMGRRAYRTIADEWNAKVAVERLLQVCEAIAAGREPEIIWESGPCSVAEVLKERIQ